MSTESNGVTYTVKELLAKLDGKLDGIIITIGQKADRHDVESLASRVTLLEAERSGNRALRDFFRWALPVVAILVAAVVTHYL